MRHSQVGQQRNKTGQDVDFIPTEDLPDVFVRLVNQSPISTWIADSSGTSIYQNEACRQLFGIEKDEEVVGRYNIFRDEKLTAKGFMPQIRKIFEEGGSTEIIVDYDFAESTQVKVSHPVRRTLRGFLFAIKDEEGKVKYVVIQHEDYTERWMAQKSLEESETLYRELVEDVSDWVWEVDLEGRFAYSSPVVERILGYRVEEIVGRSAIDLIIPEDRERARRTLNIAVSEKSEVVGLLTRFARKDGTVRYLESSGKPIFTEQHSLTGYKGIARDITERVFAEQALQRSEANLKAMFHYMPAATFAYDREGRIVQVNTAFEELYGYTSEQVSGKTISETIGRVDAADKSREIVNKVFNGESFTALEWEDHHKDGTPIFVITNTTPVYNAAGEVIMGLSLNIDITERKHAEQWKRDLEAFQREFLRRTIKNVTDGKLIICDKQEIQQMLVEPLAAWDTNRPEDMSAIRHAIADIARSAGMEDAVIDDFTLAVGEAATNAYKHAGGGVISVYKKDDSLMFAVADRGPGIDTLVLPEATLKKGYSTGGSLGIGYKAIISMAERVYLATDPTGTTVAIEMPLHPVEEGLVIEDLPDVW